MHCSGRGRDQEPKIIASISVTSCVIIFGLNFVFVLFDLLRAVLSFPSRLKPRVDAQTMRFQVPLTFTLTLSMRRGN